MAEQIIDIRERIEKMRIKIDEDQNLNPSLDEVTTEEKKMDDQNVMQTFEKKVLPSEKAKKNNILSKEDKDQSPIGSFPSVSLSVKNPISSKSLIVLMVLQIFSNLGILYLLYTLLE